jgi:hypothetical protein
MFRWWGQLQAIWDNAGQLVELREAVEALDARIDELFATVATLDERTRKQKYREGKQAEHVAFEASQQLAAPVGARAALVRAARARGLIR